MVILQYTPTLVRDEFLVTQYIIYIGSHTAHKFAITDRLDGGRSSMVEFPVVIRAVEGSSPSGRPKQNPRKDCVRETPTVVRPNLSLYFYRRNHGRNLDNAKSNAPQKTAVAEEYVDTPLPFFGRSFYRIRTISSLASSAHNKRNI